MGVFGLGIDPGLQSFGIAFVEKLEPYKVKVLTAKTLSIEEGKMVEFVDHLGGIITPFEEYVKQKHGSDVKLSSHIERFSSYGTPMSTTSEQLCNLVGMLDYYFSKFQFINNLLKPTIIRAIDWKINLVQNISKNAGFNNPAQDLNKKFSLAAAKFITENKESINNDHEADAICIASYKLLG